MGSGIFGGMGVPGESKFCHSGWRMCAVEDDVENLGEQKQVRRARR